LDQAPTVNSLDTGLSAETRGTLELWFVIAGALLFSLALQGQDLVGVWKTGMFRDTDDAMRMVQVRDLMAGQSWYDMVAHRLDPPQGLLSHWSRIVDTPLVLLVKAFGLLLPYEAAERAARIAFPFLLLVGLFRACAYAAQVFAGPRMAIAGAIAAALCSVASWQFPPGRIDHHAPQILLLTIAFAAMADSLDPARAGRAAWAAAAIALSLGIGLENMPFFVALAAAPPLAYVVQGERAKERLVAFGAALGLLLVAVFVVTIPASRWLDPACDALSIVHLTAGFGAAAAFLVLSRLNLSSPAARLAACVVAGGLVLAGTLLLFPHGLRDPYTLVDPVLRAFWLDHVQESEPFFSDLWRDPADGISWLIPYLFGVAGAALGAARSQGVNRGRWLLLLAGLAAGGVTTCWEIRAVSSTAPLMAIAALGLVAPARALLARRHAAFAGPLSLIVLLLVVSRLGVLTVASLWPTGKAAAAADLGGGSSKSAALGACSTPASFAPLAGLAPGLALAEIDAGPFLLAFTPHSVVAAPYHRNNRGNLFSLDVFTTGPDRAEALVRGSGARWLFLCPASGGFVKDFIDRAPDGLAARLIQNRPPAWLKATPLAGTPYLVFEVAAP
jgi:hypothetical protein